MNHFRSPVGALLGWLVLVVSGQQLAATWLVERYVVASGSMAPTLLGVHCHVTCTQCNRQYDIGLDSPPGTGQRAVCLECGAQGPKIEDMPVVGGDRVFIDRSAYQWRQPKRWEVIAFRSPQRPAQIHVKRVVGLPGETVEIKAGDVCINGTTAHRVSKPFSNSGSAEPPPILNAYNQTRSLRETVARDGYYTAPVGLTGALAIDRPYTLGPDEFFVLGDNSQLAVDSRWPTFGPIHAKSLVGKPIGVK